MSPLIEDYLKNAPEDAHDELLQELIHEEIGLRKEAREVVSVDEYAGRFPGFRETVVNAFGAASKTSRPQIPKANPSAVNSTVSLGPAAALESLVNSESKRYRKIRQLGQGSFGTVWLAEDVELHRQVAMKEPNSDQFADPAIQGNFIAEARTLAGLDHPNILPVYDTGRSEAGHCYVVSKYIDGASLTEKMKQGRLPVVETILIVSQIADALHYAHKNQIVHRDVKPDNILFDSAGKPWLADFGIALHDDRIKTGSQITGTPAYMSPEQVSGAGDRVDGRTDIYSLAVIMYEMLTGRRPFRSESQAELLRQIQTMDAKPLRQIDDTIPRELERVCIKALSRSVSDRYLTAKDFADELRNVTGVSAPSQILTTAGEVPQDKPADRASKKFSFAVVTSAAVVLLILAGQRILNREESSLDQGNSGSPTFDGDAVPEASPSTSVSESSATSASPSDARSDPNLLIKRFYLLASRNKQEFQPAESLVPLKSGDHVRFDIEFSQPVFARLIWVDADGRPMELFPSDPSIGHRSDQRVTRIESPVQLDSGWPVEGNSGMETAVLLISSTLPDTVPFDLLTMKPRQGIEKLSIATYFASRDLATSRVSTDKDGKRLTRGLNPAPGQVDDPVMTLLETLRQHADAVQAISLLHMD